MALTDTQRGLLENIHGKLVKGDNKAIADKVNKTEVYVSMVLNPNSDYFNMDIVEAAAKIIAARAKSIAAREQNTKKLLEQVSEISN